MVSIKINIFLLKMKIFLRFFFFYCEMYVILREKKKKLFYKNIHYMCLNYIKTGKPIYQLKVFFGKSTKPIYRL